jgi:succinate dehydrogenase / fumarate reductase flavoprotein subunit
LANWSFGGARASRTFYERGQTGQQLLLGAYQAPERQIHAGHIKMYLSTEMLDLVVVDRQARGIVARNLLTGGIESYVADAVVLATGGYVSAWEYAGDQRKLAFHKEPLEFEYVAPSQRSYK